MKVTIEKVLLIANREKEGAVDVAATIAEWLQSQDIEVVSLFYPGDGAQKPPVDCDLAISLGGDGTVLYSSRLLSPHDIPILPVNMGDFGFITEVTRDEWRDEFEYFRNGETGAGERILLRAGVMRDGEEICSFVGLNDAVISTAGISKLARLSVNLSGIFLGRYRADGMIVATPTGSTAYSVAAGGPILHPEMEALILNPICPFTISHRPLVVPHNTEIDIQVESSQRTNVVMTVDGQFECPLLPNDRVLVRAHDEKARIVRSHKRTFYEVLRTKLKLSGGP